MLPAISAATFDAVSKPTAVSMNSFLTELINWAAVMQEIGGKQRVVSKGS
jgi:hypothetical protein